MHHNFLFDLDQTLLDFHASEKVALELVLKAHGLSWSEDIYTHFKAYNKQLWLELEKGTISRTELFTLRFNDIIERSGGADRGIDPLQMNTEFIQTMSENGVLMDGAMELIQRIHRDIADARIYIITNGATVNARGRIESTGLKPYIEGLYVSDAMGVAKPAVEYFDMCLGWIGEPKESCIVIGDSLSSDMQGAKNAGLTSVWFMPEGDIEAIKSAYRISYTASSYDELYEILKAWAETPVKEGNEGAAYTRNAEGS